MVVAEVAVEVTTYAGLASEVAPRDGDGDSCLSSNAKRATTKIIPKEVKSFCRNVIDEFYNNLFTCDLCVSGTISVEFLLLPLKVSVRRFLWTAVTFGRGTPLLDAFFQNALALPVGELVVRPVLSVRSAVVLLALPTAVAGLAVASALALAAVGVVEVFPLFQGSSRSNMPAGLLPTTLRRPQRRLGRGSSEFPVMSSGR